MTRRFLSLLCFLLAATLPASAQYFSFGKNKVNYQDHDWHFLQSKHFDVYYYEPGGRALADYTARAAEAAYADVEQLFQHPISDRIAIVVYQSHGAFAVTNVANLPTEATGIAGVTEPFKNRISLPFNGSYRDYRQTLHHEIVHAVLNDMYYGGSVQNIIQNNIQLSIPHWFNEGLAEYAAEGWSSSADMWVREGSLEDDLPPIRYLGGYLSYEAGQSVWDYIAEQYGREKIGEILQRLRMTRDVDAAFRRATGLDLDELSERWQAALKKVYWPEITARESIEEIARPIATRENGGLYNTSPALSPLGDRLAFITVRDAYFDVYLARTVDGKIFRKLIASQDNTAFEELKVLTPGLAWSPDGKQIAIAVKSGPSDAIALLDVRSGQARHHRVTSLDGIFSVAWHPDGDRLAFSGSQAGQSDIFTLDLLTGEVQNLTGDRFSDYDPAWSPDGTFLVFHSDRGTYTDLHRHTAETFDLLTHENDQFDLYRLAPGDRTARRLTFDDVWDERTARFGAEPGTLIFISDRNGIPNLYEKNLDTGHERPLTDLTVGAMDVALSADGQKAAIVSLNEGTPSIYLMTEPFARQLKQESLLPTVWAQRRTGQAEPLAPALVLASSDLLRQNPLLRDAADGRAYRFGAPRPETLLATTDTTLATLPQAVDTTAYGEVRVDFRNYVFSDAFDTAAEEDDGEWIRDRFSPVDNVDEEGNLKPKKYKLYFSPDLIYGQAGFDNLYGVQTVTQMLFSDMLGNHQIYVATNLLVDLRSSDYFLAYNYLPQRTDYQIYGYHMARDLPVFDDEGVFQTFFRYRDYGGGLTASYPLDKFRRVEANLSVRTVSQLDIADTGSDVLGRTFLFPSIEYIKDVTRPGYLYPMGGHRYGISVSGSPGFVPGTDDIHFVTVLGDFRSYKSFGRFYTLALRFSGAASFGPDPQRFYTAGVQNWLNRRFSGYPIEDLEDFAFATPVLPLRGTTINQLYGRHFGLVNAEFRFPLVAALLPGPIPILPLYNIQGAAFADVGALFGTDGPLRFTKENEAGETVLDDLFVGAGLGLRTIFIGYPVRVDFAWPFDGKRFGDRRVYFSIGLDF